MIIMIIICQLFLCCYDDYDDSYDGYDDDEDRRVIDLSNFKINIF